MNFSFYNQIIIPFPDESQWIFCIKSSHFFFFYYFRHNLIEFVYLIHLFRLLPNNLFTNDLKSIEIDIGIVSTNSLLGHRWTGCSLQFLFPFFPIYLFKRSDLLISFFLLIANHNFEHSSLWLITTMKISIEVFTMIRL